MRLSLDLFFHDDHIRLHIHEALLSPLICRCNNRAYNLLRLPVFNTITGTRRIPQYAMHKLTNDLPTTDLGHDRFRRRSKSSPVLLPSSSGAPLPDLAFAAPDAIMPIAQRPVHFPPSGLATSAAGADCAEAGEPPSSDPAPAAAAATRPLPRPPAASGRWTRGRTAG